MTDPIGNRPRDPRVENAAVLSFAADMLRKLRANNHKAHWSTIDAAHLRSRLAEEVVELFAELDDGADPARVIAECADVANIAMMIADNARRSE